MIEFSVTLRLKARSGGPNRLSSLSFLSHGSSRRDERRSGRRSRSGGDRDDGEGAGDGDGLDGDGAVGAARQGQHDEQTGEEHHLCPFSHFLQLDQFISAEPGVQDGSQRRRGGQ